MCSEKACFAKALVQHDNPGCRFIHNFIQDIQDCVVDHHLHIVYFKDDCFVLQHLESLGPEHFNHELARLQLFNHELTCLQL